MKKALIVIDMLNDFLQKDGALSLGDTGPLIQKIAVRVEAFHSTGNPVIYLVDRHLPSDPEFEMFPPHCVAESRGSEIIDALRPEEGDRLIPKRRYSGFFGTDLDLTLREMGIEEVELAGVCTQICVLYTAADARMLHYKVKVHKDCVASFDPEAHIFALKEMEKTLGVVIL